MDAYMTYLRLMHGVTDINVMVEVYECAHSNHSIIFYAEQYSACLLIHGVQSFRRKMYEIRHLEAALRQGLRAPPVCISRRDRLSASGSLVRVFLYLGESAVAHFADVHGVALVEHEVGHVAVLAVDEVREPASISVVVGDGLACDTTLFSSFGYCA